MAHFEAKYQTLALEKIKSKGVSVIWALLFRNIVILVCLNFPNKKIVIFCYLNSSANIW